MNNNQDVNTTLEKMADIYLTTYPAFLTEVCTIDTTDDFGSRDFYKFIHVKPWKTEATYSRLVHVKPAEINILTYKNLRKNGRTEVTEKNEDEINPTPTYLRMIFAEQVARHFHKDQKRKVSLLPYINHVEEVVDMMGQNKKNLDDDEATPKLFIPKTIAWLHDIVEDTPITIDLIEKYFGGKVSEGVNILTRNVDETKYKLRLKEAPKNVQVIKLYDTISNTNTIHQLSDSGIKRKVHDCTTFYIPLALELEYYDIAKKLGENIKNYL